MSLDPCATSLNNILQIPSEIISDEIFSKYLENKFVITVCSLVCKNWYECSVRSKLEIVVARYFDSDSFLQCCKSRRLQQATSFSSTFSLAFVDFVKYCVEDRYGILKSLHLIYSLDECVDLVPNFTNLERLSITAANAIIGDWISNFSKLTYLNLDGNILNYELCKNIQKCELLTELNLSNNDLDDRACEYLSKLKNLTKLYVENNDIRTKGAEYLSQIQTLTELHISQNYFGDEGFVYLCSLKKLTSFQVCDCSITTITTLSELSSLVNLDIGFNAVGNEGAKIISSLSNLKSLSIAHNDVDHTGVQYLTKLSQLQSLNLRDNGLTFDEVACLNILPHLRELQIISRHRQIHTH